VAARICSPRPTNSSTVSARSRASWLASHAVVVGLRSALMLAASSALALDLALLASALRAATNSSSGSAYSAVMSDSTSMLALLQVTLDFVDRARLDVVGVLAG